MPYVQAIFVGTGDLFASCLLGWMHKDKDLKVSGIVKYCFIGILFARLDA